MAVAEMSDYWITPSESVVTSHVPTTDAELLVCANAEIRSLLAALERADNENHRLHMEIKRLERSWPDPDKYHETGSPIKWQRIIK